MSNTKLQLASTFDLFLTGGRVPRTHPPKMITLIDVNENYGPKHELRLKKSSELLSHIGGTWTWNSKGTHAVALTLDEPGVCLR